MNKPRFWDANSQQKYVQARDALTERQAQWREGSALAKDLNAFWSSLSADEQCLLHWMLINDSPSLVGRCDDPVLKRMMETGVLHWPPGVRPILNDDLVTTFHIGSVLWAELISRRDLLLPKEDEVAQLQSTLTQRFAQRWIVIGDEGQTSPLATRASN